MPPAQHPVDHPASLPIDELLRSCEAQRFRGSGPGGQHRNKVETAVRLTHHPTGVTGQASERRSQAENHKVAVTRLRINLALSVRTPPPPEDVFSALPEASVLWRSRSRGGRLAINPDHADFPALLAEALDRLAWRQHDVPTAAADLGVTGSQLLKLLRHEARALEQLNAERAAAGLSRLR